MDTKKSRINTGELRKQVNVDFSKKGNAVIGNPADKLKKPVDKKKKLPEGRQRAKKKTPYKESKPVSVRFSMDIINTLGEDHIKELIRETINEEYDHRVAKKKKG